MTKQTMSLEEYAEKKHLLFQRKDAGISNPGYIDSLFKISITNN